MKSQDVPSQYKPRTDEFVLGICDLVGKYLPVLTELGQSISIIDGGYEITVEKEGSKEIQLSSEAASMRKALEKIAGAKVGFWKEHMMYVAEKALKENT